MYVCAQLYNWLTILPIMVFHQPVKQVFSTMEFLGWYTIGGSPTKDDVDFHEQVYMYMYMYL